MQDERTDWQYTGKVVIASKAARLQNAMHIADGVMLDPNSVNFTICIARYD